MDEEILKSYFSWLTRLVKPQSPGECCGRTSVVVS